MSSTKTKLALITAISLAAGGLSPLSAQDGESALDLPSSEFKPMQRYDINYEKPRDMAEFYVRTLGLPPRAAKYEQGRDPGNPKQRIVIATVNRIADPQVKAIQWRIALKAQGGGWETVEAGLRRKCQNGPNTNEWTSELCP